MTYILRYAGSIFLLLAAALAPTVAETITFSIAGILYVLLTLSRERFPAADRRLHRLQLQLVIAIVIAQLVIFLAVLLTNLDITVARNYALLTLVALTPLGLQIELASLLRPKRHKSSETISTALGYAKEDAYAMLGIIALSFVGTLWLHIPPALSALQLLVISCVARLLLSGSGLQATLHKTNWIWRVLFTSITVYGSFLFFFIRHYLEPRYADSINPVTWQATTVALAVFATCQAALLVFNSRAPKVIAYRALLLLVVLLIIASLPLTHHYFMTQTLDASDWLWIIIASLFFTALCLLQLWTTNHNRQTVVALHRNN